MILFSVVKTLSDFMTMIGECDTWSDIMIKCEYLLPLQKAIILRLLKIIKGINIENYQIYKLSHHKF